MFCYNVRLWKQYIIKLYGSTLPLTDMAINGDFCFKFAHQMHFASAGIQTWASWKYALWCYRPQALVSNIGHQVAKTIKRSSRWRSVVGRWGNQSQCVWKGGGAGDSLAQLVGLMVINVTVLCSTPNPFLCLHY